MSKNDALTAGIPVKFFVTPSMIKGWKKSTGPRDKKAIKSLRRKSKTQAKRRKARSVSWPRSKKYKRGPKKKAGRYRPGYGPVQTIKLYRGAGISKRQARRLKGSGHAGSARSRGGTAVKLNPRRRKRRKARRKPTGVKRGAGGRFKKKRRKKARRRKAARRKNPGRKRRRRRRKATGTRRRTYRKNPGHKRRRRRRKKKGSHLARRRKGGVRRRRRRYRKNPNGLMRTLGLNEIMNQNVWIFGGQAVLGMGATAWICDTLNRQRWVPMALKTRGGQVALCAVSTGLTFAGAKIVQGFLPKGRLTRNLPANMLTGGVIYTLINALYAFAPRLFNTLRLPRPAMPAAADMAGMGRVYDGPYGRGGSYPGQYPGYGGMGSVESAAALVEGESLSRQTSAFDGMGNVGDWMELSGSPVPIEDLRGMGDWVEMNPSAQLVQEGFSPGAESF